MAKHTSGGYITTSLSDAKEAHEAHGGYLLKIGDRPPEFVVCQHDQAVECWGRTEEQAGSMRGFSEA